MKTTKSRIFSIVLLCILFCMILTGCMPHEVPSNSPAGFLSGIWHGWIAPVTLIASAFSDVQIYESNNTGFFYNLGFYMAIISGFGGLALSRKKRDK